MSEFERRMTQAQHPLLTRTMPDGTTIFVRELDFEVVTEPWARYNLKDGGSVRHRSTMNKLYQVCDPQGVAQLNPNHEPIFWTENNVTSLYSA